MLNTIRIVLVNTSHPGNIGSSARAMKTMGLSQLYLVAPQTPFPNAMAIDMAAGADDILMNAVVCETLNEALVGCKLVVGTSARRREFPLELLTPRETGEMVVAHAQGDAPVAIVFGREHAGLTNEELLACHRHVMIPANPDYSSLNLGHAVQVLAYEVRVAALADKPLVPPRDVQMPTHDELEQFYEHLFSAMRVVGFIKPSTERKLPARLRRLFMRANLEHEEMRILRGVFTAMHNMAARLQAMESNPTKQDAP